MVINLSSLKIKLGETEKWKHFESFKNCTYFLFHKQGTQIRFEFQIEPDLHVHLEFL